MSRLCAVCFNGDPKPCGNCSRSFCTDCSTSRAHFAYCSAPGRSGYGSIPGEPEPPPPTGYQTLPVSLFSDAWTVSSYGSIGQYDSASAAKGRAQPTQQASGDGYESVPDTIQAFTVGSGYQELPLSPDEMRRAALTSSEERGSGPASTDDAWQPVLAAPGSGARMYFVNVKTKETRWEPPSQYQYISRGHPTGPPVPLVGASAASSSSNSSSGARGRPGPAATRDSRREPGGVTRSGWLTKKGKRRWYVLRGSLLLWYNKQQSDDLEPAALGKHLANFIHLRNYRLEQFRESAPTISDAQASELFETSLSRSARRTRRGTNAAELAQLRNDDVSGGSCTLLLRPVEDDPRWKGYALTASSEADALLWSEALTEGLERARAKKIVSGGMRVNGKARYLTVDEVEATWYESESKTKLCGSMPLRNAKVTDGPTPDTLLLAQATDSRHLDPITLQCQSTTELDRLKATLIRVAQEATVASRLRANVARTKSLRSVREADPGSAPLLPGDLASLPFFHGNVSGEDAYSLLYELAVGTFLVRQSSREGHFVVSWVQSPQVVVHTLMSFDPPSTWTLEGDSKRYQSATALFYEYSHSFKVPLAN